MSAAMDLPASAEAPTERWGSRAWTRRIDRMGGWCVRFVALLSVAAILLILIFVLREALPIFTSAEVHREVTFGSLFTFDAMRGPMWQPVSDVPAYNILPLIAGSVKVTIIALLIAAPLSIGAAVYVAEFAGKRTREMIKPAIELLAGIPSVVVGFFALIVLATWVQKLFGTTHRLNALVAGLGLAIAVCPVVFSVSEDAIRAVPMSYRIAAMALGSSRLSAITRIVLPAAAPGILASLVLGFGRAIGETMIVVLASGNAAILSASAGLSTRTITATIAQELGEVVVGSPHYHVLFVLGAMLLLSTLVLNLAAERVMQRLRRQLGQL
jgi:phosphate transport system permease protein